MPVTEAKLPFITYSVGVLGAPEDIDHSPVKLNVKRHGVIVSCGRLVCGNYAKATPLALDLQTFSRYSNTCTLFS